MTTEYLKSHRHAGTAKIGGIAAMLDGASATLRKRNGIESEAGPKKVSLSAAMMQQMTRGR